MSSRVWNPNIDFVGKRYFRTEYAVRRTKIVFSREDDGGFGSGVRQMRENVERRRLFGLSSGSCHGVLMFSG